MQPPNLASSGVNAPQTAASTAATGVPAIANTSDPSGSLHMPGQVPGVDNTVECNPRRLAPLQLSQGHEAPQLHSSLTVTARPQATPESQQFLQGQATLNPKTRLSAGTPGDAFSPDHPIAYSKQPLPPSLPSPLPQAKTAPTRFTDAGLDETDTLSIHNGLHRDNTLRTNHTLQIPDTPGSTLVHTRRMSRRNPADWTPPKLSVHTRLAPTIRAAEEERVKSLAKAKKTGMILNMAIGLQIILAALTTSLSAVATTGRQTAIQTTVLGALSTLIGSFLARARGSGEPHLSQNRAKELDRFIRELNAFDLDHGYEVENEKYEEEVDVFRKHFEQILGHGTRAVKRRSSTSPHAAGKATTNDTGEKKLTSQV